MHGIPFFLLLVDFLLNSYQFPIRHFLVSLLVAITYIIINQIYACNGNPVYDVYKCGDVLLPLGAIAIMVIGHTIGFLVWKFFRSKKI